MRLCLVALISCYGLGVTPLVAAEMSGMEKALFNQFGEDLKISYLISGEDHLRRYGTVKVEDISDELIDAYYSIIEQHDHEKNILNKNNPDWRVYNTTDTMLHMNFFIDGIHNKENRYLYGVIRVIREKKQRVWSDKVTNKRIENIKKINSWDALQKEVERFFNDLLLCNEKCFSEADETWELKGSSNPFRVRIELVETAGRIYEYQYFYLIGAKRPASFPALYFDWQTKFFKDLGDKIQEIKKLQTMQK